MNDSCNTPQPSEAELVALPCDDGVSLVAYLVGNPWPICHECKRHVYLVEQMGEWRHFDAR